MNELIDQYKWSFFHDKIYIYVSKICIYSIIQNV